MADEEHESGSTRVSEVPMPPAQAIGDDPQFVHPFPPRGGFLGIGDLREFAQVGRGAHVLGRFLLWAS